LNAIRQGRGLVPLTRYLTILLTFLALTAGWAGAQAAWTVTPGEGVGAISLGMSSQSIQAVLKPSRVIGKENNPLLIEYGSELAIEYSGNKASIISLHSNTFQTRNGPVGWVPYKGLKVGASWSSAAAQLPARKLSRKLPTAKGYPEEFYHAYKELGIGVRVKGSSIIQVDIWDAN